jgi:hypothetical protein
LRAETGSEQQGYCAREMMNDFASHMYGSLTGMGPMRCLQ